jgi:hypothetical protein
MVKVNFQLPFHSGTTDHAIRFHTNDPQRPEVSFSVHVLARWPVSANPVALHFPSVRLGKGARQEVEIVSTTGTPFELTEIRVSSREVDVKQVHRDQRRAVLAVEVRPSTVGPIHETIEVATTVPERPTLVIPVEGESVTGVGYSPRIIFMGRKTPGSAHHAELAVSTGEQEIGVTAVRIDEPGWSVTDWKIQPGSEREGEWSIHLDVAVPSTAGRVHGTLLIDSAKGTLKIPVSAIIASTSRESAVQ